MKTIHIQDVYASRLDVKMDYDLLDNSVSVEFSGPRGTKVGFEAALPPQTVQALEGAIRSQTQVEIVILIHDAPGVAELTEALDAAKNRNPKRAIAQAAAAIGKLS